MSADPYAYEVQVHLDGTISMVPVETPYTYSAAADSRLSAETALDAIAEVMSGNEWNSMTLDVIADLVQFTGRVINDSAEYDDEVVDEPLGRRVVDVPGPDQYGRLDELLQQRAETMPDGVRGAIARARLALEFPNA